MTSDETQFPCDDYAAFKDALLKSRKLDDNIIYLLNKKDTARTADQIDCGSIWNSLQRAASDRRAAISRCQNQTEKRVTDLRDEEARTSDSHKRGDVYSLYRLEEKKLGQLKLDAGVEEVLNVSNQTLFRKRCRSFVIPNSSQDNIPTTTSSSPSSSG